MGTRRRFSREFKLGAIRLLKQGERSAAQLARELGVPRNRLYKWEAELARSGEQAFPGKGRITLGVRPLSIEER